jgi:triacylglycerol lipase
MTNLAEPTKETVVLLHGLGRSRLSLHRLRKRLRKAGFETANFPYAPTIHRFETIVGDLHDFIVEKVATERYHLVGHSLGNIIIRARFRLGYPAELGHIVMLGPPNQPPKLARKLRKVPPFRLWAGDSGQQLASPEFYATLPTPDVPFGVIAGDKGPRLVFDEPNDGVVTVASTRLAGMAEHLVLPHTHTFMMNSPAVAKATINFLRHGRFE